jgi:hypothetical protein
MKKSRLLEIIREEISTALSEITMVDKKTDATEAGEIAKKEEKDLPTVQAAIKTAKTTGKPVAVAEEDLNEIPDFGGRFDKQVADKYGEEDTLEAAMEKVVNRTLSDRGISKADVSKMDKEGLKDLLRTIRQQISGKGQTPAVAQALKKQIEFDDSGSKLQDNQTNNAILKALGLVTPKPRGRKADPNKPEKPASTGKKGRPAGAPKAEKVATRTPGDDGFDKVEYSDVDGEDKEATQNVGSDSTAKELGKEADVSKNPDFDRIRKGLQNKRKNSKDGILSPEDMKLAVNIINTAKDKYKFNTTQVDSLRADIGL